MTFLLSNFTKSTHLSLYIKDEIRSLENEGKKIKLYWIPNHCGISDNKLADFNAKEAVHLGIDFHIEIPPRDFKKYWYEILRTEFNEWCQLVGNTKDSFYTKNYLDLRNKPWFHKLLISRKVLASIVKLRSGHSNLRSSLYRFKIVDNPLCPNCGVVEDINHVFWQCPRFNVQRSLLIKKTVKVFGHFPIPIESILAWVRGDAIWCLEEFIENIDFVF